MGQNKYKRKSPSRIQKDTIYIICGGETEEIYFNMFKEKFQAQILQRKIKIIKNSLDPLNLIKYCISLKEQKKDCLRLWAVFDRDDFDNFDEAIKLAKSNCISCAYSNQAFEVWLINHYQELHTPLHRKQYSETIKRLTEKEYAKNNRSLKQIISAMMDMTMIEKAIKNSEIGHKKHVYEGQGEDYSSYESCTTVYKLIKELLKK